MKSVTEISDQSCFNSTHSLVKTVIARTYLQRTEFVKKIMLTNVTSQISNIDELHVLTYEIRTQF